MYNLPDKFLCLNPLNNIPVVPSEECRLTSFFKNYDSLFPASVGLFKDVKDHLTLKESSNPLFLKDRLVPYGLREKVDSEINRLLDEEVLVPLKYSD